MDADWAERVANHSILWSRDGADQLLALLDG